MLKLFTIIAFLISFNSFSETTSKIPKPDPRSQINAEEQIHGLPGGSVGGAYSVRAEKKIIRMPSAITPAENHSPASCASSLNAQGSANYTACEAAKKTR